MNSGTYYGLSWNTSNLGAGNDFINFLISGAVEYPAYTFLLLTLDRWGRKVIQCGCMLFAGTALLLTMFFPEGQSVLYSAIFLTLLNLYVDNCSNCIGKLKNTKGR